MPSTHRLVVVLTLTTGLAACAPAKETPVIAGADPAATGAADSWCSQVPRLGNEAFPRAGVTSDWFDVYEVDSGVFALTEPRQFQETISYLIVGSTSALLFDTGLGVVPIRPVVEQLTTLPVRVLNSHTHYDHVGGNAEFETVLAVATPFTTANQRGFPHAEVAGEVAAESFCGGPPTGADTGAYLTRAWRMSRVVADGDTLDLGGRVLEILQVPGHTPDAVALLDRAHQLLWTGDTYYDGPVWLYVPETDLDAYERSIARLGALAPPRTRLLPAHNVATAEPARLGEMAHAIRAVREGTTKGVSQGRNRILFPFEHFSILTSQPLLDGATGDRTRGGSGLTTWP
ncbi:MAG: MBL fold metallo-hydrolase [Gemmatimonadota bacterium]